MQSLLRGVPIEEGKLDLLGRYLCLLLGSHRDFCHYFVCSPQPSAAGWLRALLAQPTIGRCARGEHPLCRLRQTWKTWLLWRSVLLLPSIAISEVVLVSCHAMNGRGRRSGTGMRVRASSVVGPS